MWVADVTKIKPLRQSQGRKKVSKSGWVSSNMVIYSLFEIGFTDLPKSKAIAPSAPPVPTELNLQSSHSSSISMIEWLGQWRKYLTGPNHHAESVDGNSAIVHVA